MGLPLKTIESQTRTSAGSRLRIHHLGMLQTGFQTSFCHTRIKSGCVLTLENLIWTSLSSGVTRKRSFTPTRSERMAHVHQLPISRLRKGLILPKTRENEYKTAYVSRFALCVHSIKTSNVLRLLNFASCAMFHLMDPTSNISGLTVAMDPYWRKKWKASVFSYKTVSSRMVFWWKSASMSALYSMRSYQRRTSPLSIDSFKAVY